jgi:diguanylate cyclase (GGDEF)-like protein/PAS domain S-box-containing protein
MERVHSLLTRQLKHHVGSSVPDAREWRAFLDAVNKAYREFDADRAMLERSLDLSSRELLQANSQMRAIFRAFPDFFFRLNSDGVILDYKAGGDMDFSLAPEDLLGKRIQDLPLQSVGDTFAGAIKQVRDTKMMVSIEYMLVLQHHETFFEARLVPVLDDQLFVIVRNITTRKRAEIEIRRLNIELEQRVIGRTEDLARSVSLLKATFEATADGILVVDTEGTIVSFNQKFIDIWRLSGDVVARRDLEQTLAHMAGQLNAPDSLLRTFRALDTERDADSSDTLEFADGRVFECSSQPQRVAGGSVGRVWSFRDITERKRAQEALAEQAVRDVLTDLYNRRYFNHRVPQELKRAEGQRQAVAILLCDLDHFKAVNDTLGHHVGDDVLKMVARSIRAAIRGTDLVFRWGGDEFVVVLEYETRDGLHIATERIRAGVRKINGSTDHSLDLSIGVAIYPEHGRSIDQLIRLADRALYIAKKGGGKVHIGEEEYYLNEQAISVVFQPIVEASTRRVIGYEALSRDRQGKLGILELFKRYEAIGQLDELKRICFREQLRAAQAAGLARVFINVNFSVIGAMECLPKPPHMRVILEISELEALHDVARHLEITRRWREQGFEFAIDDFGAGFVSFPFIAEAIPDYIKVDRSTLLQAVSSPKFRAFSKDLVRAIRNYASKGIIVEGVETDQELEVVKELGIDLVQGYLFGKPQSLPVQDQRAA